MVPRSRSHRSDLYHSPLPSQELPLTKLYSDAKHAFRNVAVPQNAQESPEIVSLHRKFRMQKDRLIAWGFDWSDNATADGSIDESVERAGLTEVVFSVMENIADIMDQAQKLRNKSALSPAGFPLEKSSTQSSRWSPDDQAQYADLVRDLTSSLDLLCDLSKSRRPDFQMVPSEKAFSDEKRMKFDENMARGLPQYPQEKAGYEEPQTLDSLKLDRHSIMMPEETPPPYDSSGIPSPVRIVGRLRTGIPARDFKGATHPTSTRPVLIEYASYDNLYQNTGVPLPFDRVEQLATILRAQGNEPSLLKFIGYFEDAPRPRIGVVYELPSSIPADFANSMMAPVTLQNLLQNSIKTVKHTESASAAAERVPALEQRFHLARELLTGASRLLSNSFTHRDMNSNSIIFFPTGDPNVPTFACGTPNVSLREPVVCSFDLFSEYNIDAPPANLHQNMYRHPEDSRLKGAASSSEFESRFDMYSIGLVLLEIGLWTPLTHIFKQKYSLDDFKVRIDRIWVKKLQGRCGTTYMRAVQDCMFAASIKQDQDQLKQTLDRAIARIARCCLIFDEDDEPLQQSTPGPSVPPELTRQFSAPIASPLPQISDSPEPMDIATTRSEPVADIPAASTPADTKKCSILGGAKRFFPDELLPQYAVDMFQNGLDDCLAKLIHRALPRKESCSFSLELVGTSQERAKPTIVVTCQSTKLVKALIRRHFKYDTNTFDVAILPGTILRSKTTRSTDKPHRSVQDEEIGAANPDHHERPVCGASIGVWQDSQHSPAASFGGVVLVDGEPYGMSVHHLLEEPEEESDAADEEEPPELTRSSAKAALMPSTSDAREFLFDSFEDSQIDSDDDDDDFEFPDNISDMDATDLDDDFNDGDTAGIEPGEGEEIIITQPALADVREGFFPSDEDRDEDHLDSHALGHVHASSGLRRITHDAVDHEIDWALFKLKPERLQPVNLIPGGRRFSNTAVVPPPAQLVDPVCRRDFRQTEDLYPKAIARGAELGGLRVHCSGRTSGLAGGQISRVMQLVRLPGRSTFTKSWSVAGGEFGRGGDSGAWVADESGRVCGHVLAWSEALQRAYIAPMDVLFEDIRRTLGAAVVCLPGGAQLQPSAIRAMTSASSSPSKSQLPELEALKLEGSRSGTPVSQRLLAEHMLLTGNQTHLEREWSRRRAALGGMAS